MVGFHCKEELKCVLTDTGELLLMMAGAPMMPKLYADNWDILDHVRRCNY